MKKPRLIRALLMAAVVGHTSFCACSQSPADASQNDKKEYPTLGSLNMRQTETISSHWAPDEIVNPEEVDVFSINAITEDIYDRIYGKSFKEDCTTDRDDLRYLRVMHHDGKGNVRVGEIVCNVEIAEDLIDIFRNLYDAEYPIESLVLIDEFDANDDASMDANNSSCFNFRKIAGTNRLSNHSTGMAIDINPLYNPWVKTKKDGSLSVSPEKGRPYAKRNRSAKYPLIDKQDEAWFQFTSHGFTWGGDWTSSKDYQHFEKKIE